MRYKLTESETPGWWVVTDVENLVVLRFKEHEFNETQKVSILDESRINPMALPRIMREIGDWLAAHHIDKIF